jgi:hypothetical protein
MLADMENPFLVEGYWARRVGSPTEVCLELPDLESEVCR